MGECRYITGSTAQTFLTPIPQDPIVRLFSEIDALYPLVGDLGEDGKTVYASGPPRTLRPITRAIIESWEGWPRFRDTAAGTGDQNFTGIGVQHILLPDPLRYVSDRLVSANIQVPPVDSIMRISSPELLPALEVNFPLDTFQISFVPVAIRSFVHHYYPAYDYPIMEFVKRSDPKKPPPLSTKRNPPRVVKRSMSYQEDSKGPVELNRAFGPPETSFVREKPASSGGGGGPWSPGAWLQFRSE